MNGANPTAGALALAILGGGVWWMGQGDGGVRQIVDGAKYRAGSDAPAPDPASLVIPDFTPAAAVGEQAFDQYCARCHGDNAAGTEQGPPLVNRIYEPGHHADMAFALAARRGVRAHHWRFGDMPPVEGVSDEELAAITRYVRELQRANGIE